MRRLSGGILIFAAVVSLSGFHALALADEKDVAAEGPEIEDLGDERYRVGTITVDKAVRKFSLRGRVLHLVQPLEYLAVKTGGYKEYESLLELDTTAVAFQLACILVGLDDANSVKPRYQFDERAAEGQAVGITISWEVDGVETTTSAGKALTSREGTFENSEWVYIGSGQSPQDGSLLAEAPGTLIGFVHDPFSIIEHREGVGAGSYGMVTGNAEVLPPEGSPITLTVSVITD